MNENLSLNDRFKSYLEREFRNIAPCREAMDYRLEVYANLTDRAHELKIKGMTDEDAIFNLCIDCLGDFQSTLKDFESRVVNAKKSAPKVGAVLGLVLCSLLFMAILYLVISFVTRAWDRTWLIFVGGIFLGLCAYFVTLTVKAVKKRNCHALRLLTSAITAMLFVFAYLFMLMCFDIKYDWMMFLLMTIAGMIVNTALSYLFNCRGKLLLLMFAIPVVTSLLYVMLAICGAIDWSPYWLMPVCAALADAAILTLTLYRVSKKNRDLPSEEEIEKANEEYYTRWED